MIGTLPRHSLTRPRDPCVCVPELIAALAPDRFHMNDKGYGCLAEALTAEIGRMTEPSSVATAPAVALTAVK